MNNTQKVQKKSQKFILFVDDEVKATKYFEKIFSQDFNILTANSAADAWNLIIERHNEIAVVMTDQRMPNSTGIDLLNKVKSAYPNIVRILTTAFASLDNNITAINQCNIFAYLTKPWNLEEMKVVLCNGLMEFEARYALIGLSGSIAHEMRNPLNSIANSFEMVRILLPKKPENNDDNSKFYLDKPNLLDIYEIIEEGKKTIKRGNKIIDSILASIRGDEIDYGNFTKLFAFDTIKFAINSFGYETIKDRELIIVNHKDDFHFLGDRDLFIYVIFNLIKNSLYYKNDNQDFKIEITIEKSGEKNFIKVKDNGIGIDKEHLATLFESFATSGKKGGTGLGLPFCKRVINSFGGEMTCNSQLGKWTEFTIEFPDYNSRKVQEILHKSLQKKQNNQSNQHKLESLNANLVSGKTILFVDDDLVTNKMTSRILRAMGFEVFTAFNGAEAIKVLAKEPIDIILTDIEMPIMNGIEMVKQIRSGNNKDIMQYKDAFIIAATGNVDDQHLERIKNSGFNDLLKKPFFKEDFLTILAGAVR